MSGDLAEVEGIKRLKYKYVRCLDQKLWDDIATCFVPEATASYGGGAYVFEGRDAILTFLRDSMGSESFLSSHVVSQPEIELTGPDTATGVWKLEDVAILVDLGITVRGAAFYSDEYVKVDGDWKIRATGYKRSFEFLEPNPPDAKLTASWFGTGGKSTLNG